MREFHSFKRNETDSIRVSQYRPSFHARNVTWPFSLIAATRLVLGQRPERLLLTPHIYMKPTS